MSFHFWGPKPSVAELRRKAEKKVAEMRKKGHVLAPITLESRTIASSFWGKAWCQNLERYADLRNRLERGRSYVRHGAVVDLQVERGKVLAKVNGSALYNTRVTIKPLTDTTWRAIQADCASSIAGLIELLNGKLSKAVMERVSREGDGLYPAPKEIEFSCSCPDGAFMCKHVAAVLYGIGARLDALPELLFTLRGVDPADMIAGADVAAAERTAKPASSGKVLSDADLADVFGLDMVAAAPTTEQRASVRAGSKQKTAIKRSVREVKADRSKSRNSKAKSRARTQALQ